MYFCCIIANLLRDLHLHSFGFHLHSEYGTIMHAVHMYGPIEFGCNLYHEREAHAGLVPCNLCTAGLETQCKVITMHMDDSCSELSISPLRKSATQVALLQIHC